MQLGWHLQLFVCLLHANELPIRHLVRNWTVVLKVRMHFLGRLAEFNPVVKNYLLCSLNSSSLIIVHLSIEPISIQIRDHRSDLFNIYEAISSEHCRDDLALEKPRPVIYARWLTTANRLLRWYMATKNPNDDLVKLTTYVVHVYAHVWFNIKTNSACSEGARHVWKMVQHLLSKYLQPELRTVVDAVIRRNAYFCHPENLLLAMLRDERSHIRELACRRILAARRANTGTLARIFMYRS